jgi:beta-galactosidase
MTTHYVPGSAVRRQQLASDWRFSPVDNPLPENWADESVAAANAAPGLDDSAFELVSVPHALAPLSWRQWDKSGWEKVWSYRNHFDLPKGATGRIFVDFEAVMTNATVSINGVRVGKHLGGYLPFSFEITDQVKASGNVLAVLVDSRFNLNVPPNIPIPVQSESIDFWQPGGIYGSVSIRFVPDAFITDVVAMPLDVLDPVRRRVEVSCSVDARVPLTGATVKVVLQDAEGNEVASTETATERLEGGQVTEIGLVLDSLEDVELWGVDAPTLYTVVTTIEGDGIDSSVHRTRIGFREARFELDGFYLNGERLYLFGANRHQHYPFAGFAMPARVQRKDAEILRTELNCVMVRCSHYPQLSSFLDACDELGLLVWEESPGWQYVGDDEWRERATDDIRSMVLRDRNRPSVIIWGARLNETPDHPEFYSATEAMVKELDPTRATSGTMCGLLYPTEDFQHDVFAYDDYSIDVLPDGDHRPTLLPPREHKPYLIAETVTSWSSPARLYRRADEAVVQQHQAMDYAHVHNLARSDSRYTGVLAWSGFDYLAGHVVNYQGIKTSGMADLFRVLKPGAAMYAAQVDPAVRVVLAPAFTWDPPTGAADARAVSGGWGPGEKAVVFSNCDRIEVTVGGVHRATARPDRENFPHLVTAPTIVDLTIPEGLFAPELLLEGFIGNERVIVRRFDGDRSGDRLVARADDDRIASDGVDATRVEFGIADRFGELRGSVPASVAVELSGPGELIGETPFDLASTGGSGAVWVRSREGEGGTLELRLSHPQYGTATASIESGM